MSDEPPTGSSIYQRWHKRIRRYLRFRPEDREELIELLRELEHRNLVHPEALAMMEGALLVAELQVRDIMVPRAQMVMVEDHTDIEEFLPVIIESGHSRFPVLDARRDEVIGILLAKDLLSYVAAREHTDFDLWEVMRPAVFVPESKRLNVLLREFRSSRNHMAIVVDEYRRVAGLCTIEDVIEQIVGEISDEYDKGEEGFIKKHRDDRYTVKARTPISDFNDYFGTHLEDEEFDTIGGLVLKTLGHMPSRGESVDFGEYRFTILRSDARRIHLLRVSTLPGGDAVQESSTQQASVG